MRKPAASIRHLYSQYGRWAHKLTAAIGDQVLFAGSNFVTNWLLARWMLQEEYGAVAVAFGWFILIQTFYEALLVSPLSFFGADKYQKTFKRYLGYVFTAHSIMGAVIAVTLAGAALLIYQFNSVLLGQAMAGAAAASFFLLARGLIRQPFYILSKPEYSALGGAVYLVSNVGCTYLLYRMDMLTPFTALGGMGAASLITVIVQMLVLKPVFTGQLEGITPRTVIIDHWNHGKWAVSARGISWISSNFGMMFIPLVTGFSGSATLRATMILVSPLTMANSALVSLLTPMFVRTYKANGAPGLDRRVRRITQAIMVVTGAYFLVLTIFGKQLISLLYAGKYDDSVSTLFIACCAALPFITTISRILDSALVGMGKIRLSFQSKIVPTILTVVLDVILVVPFGVLGIAIESLLTAALTQFNVRRYYRRKLAQDEQQATDDKQKAAAEDSLNNEMVGGIQPVEKPAT